MGASGVIKEKSSIFFLDTEKNLGWDLQVPLLRKSAKSHVILVPLNHAIYLHLLSFILAVSASTEGISPDFNEYVGKIKYQ